VNILSNDKQLHIIFDNRERKLIDIFSNREDILVETQKLDVADVIVAKEVAIERKTGLDFIMSIMDKRLFDQLIRLMDSYETPILIIEGFNDDALESTGMRLSSIYGALAYVSYKLKICVIPTRNIDDTAIVIERIAIREQVKDEAPLLSRSAPKRLNLAENIEDRRAYIMEGLYETGPKKAKLLIDNFKTPFKVFQAIKNSHILFTKTGNPKGIEGPLSKIKGFGHKYLKRNKDLILGAKQKKVS